MTTSVMAAKKVSAKKVIEKQKLQLDAEKEKTAKLQGENEALRQKMMEGNMPSGKSWWETDSKKDCVGGSSVGSFLGSTLLGYGIGDHNIGAQVAGEAILLATFIMPSDSSFRCIVGGAITGAGIGNWGGLKHRQDREDENKKKQSQQASFGSGSGSGGTSTNGGTTLPPPPPNAPPVVKVMPFLSQNFSEENGRPNPVAGEAKKGERFIGISLDYHF